MEIKEAIFERRSIRHYSNEKVSEENIDEMIRSGMMAPSARNQQPWHFLVISDEEKLKSSAKANPNASMAVGAPLGIVVCADLSIEETEGYWAVGCAAAIQNMLLCAHSLGLGAVWTAIYPRPERISKSRKIFELPDIIMPVALLVIGHPAEVVQTPNRYNAERIHREQW